MKEIKDKINRKHWILLTFLFVVIGAGTCMAWFSYTHRLSTISVFQTPSRITISGANRSEMQQISLELTSDDIRNGNQVSIRRVFCIESTDDYLLGIARTTNIEDMDIKIYPVSVENSEPGKTSGAVKGNAAGQVFYYDPDQEVIEGDYLNQNNANIAIQKGNEGSLHDKVYAEGDIVQQNAEPLYWLSNTTELYNKSGYSRPGKAADGKTDIYYRYYVLEISWSVTDAETDMVYLLASHE